MIIFGHRGAKGSAPENTMISFQTAHRLGVSAVELDVQLSRDGEVVICHDYTIDRTSNGTGAIAQFTLQELKGFDFGSWFSPKFKGEKIPTLDEFLEWLATTSLEANIELKNGPFIYQGIEDKVLWLIERYNLTDRIIISSFYHPSIRRVKAINPGVRTAVLFECRPIDPYSFIQDTGADLLHCHWQYAEKLWIMPLQELGIRVNTYTVNLTEEYCFARQAGVDGIFTDFPERFLRK